MSDTNSPTQTSPTPPSDPQTVQNLNQHIADATEKEKIQIHQDPKAALESLGLK